MPTVAAAIKLGVIAFTLAAIAYYVICLYAATKFFSRSPVNRSSGLLPVTILIPLYGADFEAYDNYASFCRQDYPEYQIVFGVRDSRDPSIPIVRQLIADFPDRDIELVICADTMGKNPKVSNLQNMLAWAKHEQIVIVDSDIRVGEDYLRHIIPPLGDERVGLVTCLYRAAKAPNWASRLEAIGITAEFAPGVLVARQLEGMAFALGATMATTRRKLESIGGLHAIADYLSDDFMLGNLMSKAGYQVRLSRYVVQTVLAPVSFFSMMKHQIRWARGTRICRPMGYLGLILTYGTALALLNVILDRGSMLSLLLLSSTLAVRLTMGWRVGVRWLGDDILRKYIWLLPVRDILSFLIWCVSLVGKKVEWRGEIFEILEDGRVVPVS